MKKNLLLFSLSIFLLSTTAWGGIGLSGDYYIPQGGNPQGFATLEAAIAQLNIDGASSAVRFLIDADLSEIGANLALLRADLSAVNNLVIKPAPTKTPTITFTGCTNTAGATQYTGLAMSGASYVTIDGSNTLGGTSKDLTFSMNDPTNGRNVVQLYGNCDNVTIKNLNIVYQSPMSSSTSTRGIYVNGQSTGAVDNFTVDNCNIGDATNTPYYAAGITGSSGSSIYCTNVVIKNSNLYGRIRPVYFYYVGSSGTCEISKNYIYTYGGLNGTTTYTVMFNIWGGTINIFNNRLPVISTNNTVNSGIFGISGLGALAGATCNIYNNFIGGGLSFTGTGVPTVISLMYLQDNASYTVYHNSFNFNNVANSTERSCIHISGATANVTLKNNIIVNQTDATNAYCIWKSNGTLTSDYNDLYVSGASANVGYIGGAANHSLADWQTASSQDANSISKAVTFLSTTDLHISGASNGDIDLTGTPLAGYTTDIDGDTRNAGSPYMGADEASITLPVQLAAFSVVVDPNSNTAVLRWTTISEINNYGFTVQRKSENGEFADLPNSFLPGHGTTNEPQNYTWTDLSVTPGAWYYRLKQLDLDGTIHYTEPVLIDIVTGVSETNPTAFSLSQNFPNPFNPETRIVYSLSEPAAVTLTVYNVTGQEIASLVSEEKAAGRFEVVWNATSNTGAKVASGMYFYRLTAKPANGGSPFSELKKMILLK